MTEVLGVSEWFITRYTIVRRTHDGTTGKDHLFASEAFAEEEREQAACSATDVVYGCEETLDCVVRVVHRLSELVVSSD